MGPELLTPAEVARVRARRSRPSQEPDGAIPWTVGGHTDVWNHVEAAMALLVAGRLRRRRPRLGVGPPHPARATAPGR